LFCKKIKTERKKESNIYNREEFDGKKVLAFSTKTVTGETKSSSDGQRSRVQTSPFIDRPNFL
jgi:hypothetical protein